MGKSFPHPVGVFCTIPNHPNCHILPKIDVSGYSPYLAISHNKIAILFNPPPFVPSKCLCIKT